MKKLNDLLCGLHGNPRNSTRFKNRADIMVRKDEILSEMLAGWSMRDIWRALLKEGEITCSYSAFANQVKRLCDSTKRTDSLSELPKPVVKIQ